MRIGGKLMNDYAKIIAQDLGRRVRQSLLNVNAIKDDATLFVWPREERVVCLVDPLGIHNINALLSERSRHQIQTACQGRRVVFTNHRGAFIQVAYQPEPHVELKAMPLDFAQQPSPLHVPIGMTRRGPLWLSLAEMDAILIGGARRMGKTRLIHGWIKALQQGGECLLFLWDGKQGLEFSRYASQRNTTVANDLKTALMPILDEVHQREGKLKAIGVSSLKEYNAQTQAKLLYIALIVDEAAFISKEAEPIIIDLVARCGAYGVHPIIATQRPDAEVLNGLLRANLSTRIALPVPSRFDSQVILGRSGAEKLTKTPGRLLVSFGARIIEVQAFSVDVVTPTTAATLAPATSALTHDDRRLIKTAIEKCEGFFRIKELSEITHISHKAINDIAKTWELRGWLTSVQRTPEGRPLGRQVTDLLKQQVGFGGLVDQGNLVD
jgi:FtsK/SpoIIIE family